MAEVRSWKKKIASQNLTNKEYEKAIKELCKKLRM